MKRVSVGLTVPDLNPASSPAGEVRAIARYLPRDDFALTVWSLGDNGVTTFGSKLQELGHSVQVVRFRPRGSSVKAIRNCVRARKADQHGFDRSSDFGGGERLADVWQQVAAARRRR